VKFKHGRYKICALQLSLCW